MNTPKIERIVLTTDLSDASWAALETAAELGEKLGASLTVLSVIEEPVYLAHLPMSERVVEMLREVEPMVREDIARHLEVASVKAEIVVVVGRDSPTVIVENARELGADLVVMSCHGRSGLSRMLLGSVTERVLRRCPVPVLTVRAPEPE